MAGKSAVGDRDLTRLVTHRGQLPGADVDTPLLVVSRSGCTIPGVIVLGPEVLLEGWQRPDASPAAG